MFISISSGDSSTHSWHVVILCPNTPVQCPSLSKIAKKTLLRSIVMYLEFVFSRFDRLKKIFDENVSIIRFRVRTSLENYHFGPFPVRFCSISCRLDDFSPILINAFFQFWSTLLHFFVDHYPFVHTSY